MADYFDEVADKMAASLSVGQFHTRQTIIAALRARFKTEMELREYFSFLMAEAEKLSDTESLLIRRKEGGAYLVTKQGTFVNETMSFPEPKKND